MAFFWRDCSGARIKRSRNFLRLISEYPEVIVVNFFATFAREISNQIALRGSADDLPFAVEPGARPAALITDEPESLQSVLH